MYVVSMAALFKLRAAEPALPRPFMAPAYPFFPAFALAAAVVCLGTMIFFNPLLAAIFVGLAVLGYVYFLSTAGRRGAALVGGVDPGMSRGLIVLFAFCCGALVGNLYLAQPIVGLIAPDVGLSTRSAGLIVALTQARLCARHALPGAARRPAREPPADDAHDRRLPDRSRRHRIRHDGAGVLRVHAAAWGIGTSAVQMLVPLAAHLAPEATRGRVVGNVMSGLLLGIMLARPLSSFVADAFGWRTVFVAAAVITVVVEVAFAFTMPRHQPQHRASYGALLRSLGTLLRRQPVLRRRAFGQACMFASFILFWTAVPLELTSRHGFTQTQIAVFTLVGAMGAISAPIGGRLADAGYARIATPVLMSVAVLAYLPGLFGAGRQQRRGARVHRHRHRLLRADEHGAEPARGLRRSTRPAVVASRRCC